MNCYSWTASGGGIVNPACASAPTGTASQYWVTVTTSATATSWAFEVKRVGWALTDPAFQVYSGACGALTLQGCYNTSGAGSNEKATLTLSPSTTYFIRVFDADGSVDCSGGGRNYQFSTCFYDYKVGDDCSNAIPVTLSDYCGYTTYSNAGLIRSDKPNPSCGNGSTAQDMWFTFTTDATGTVAVDLRPGTITDSGMEIYSGTCGSLVSVGCSDDKGLAPTYPNALMSRLQGALTPNTQYYVRVWRWGGGTGTFEACFRKRPNLTNDICSTPMSLALSTTYQVTNWGSTINTATDPATGACNGSLDNSVWFSFTTTIAGDYTIDLTNQMCSQGTGVQMNVGRWTGASCVSANWTSVTCTNSGNCNNSTTTLTGLLASTTYFIFIDGWGAMEEDVDFNIRVTPPVPLPITLIKFECESIGDNNIILNWVTASEINNDYFILESSRDGYNWHMLAKVNGSGNSTETRNYSYVDDNGGYGVTYYRLTQVDYDGKSETFNIVSCLKDDNKGEIKTIKFYDILGQEINKPSGGLFIKVTTYKTGVVDVDKVYVVGGE